MAHFFLSGSTSSSSSLCVVCSLKYRRKRSSLLKNWIHSVGNRLQEWLHGIFNARKCACELVRKVMSIESIYNLCKLSQTVTVTHTRNSNNIFIHFVEHIQLASVFKNGGILRKSLYFMRKTQYMPCTTCKQ